MIPGAQPVGGILSVAGAIASVFGAKDGGYPQEPEYKADGGFISFKPKGNDRIPAMFDSSEVILNKRQQNNFMRLVDDKTRPSGSSGVTINIHGDFLGTAEQADKLAKVIEQRSKNNFNRIALR
jgi:hypothetical protein